MAGTPHRGLARLYHALLNSIKGFRAAWRGEEAFRQEVVMAAVGIPLAFYVSHSAVERCLLIGSILIVLITELLNTGLEVVVDRISDEHHELSGRAKDLGSSAVLVSLLLAGVIWALVLLG